MSFFELHIMLMLKTEVLHSKHLNNIWDLCRATAGVDASSRDVLALLSSHPSPNLSGLTPLHNMILLSSLNLSTLYFPPQLFFSHMLHLFSEALLVFSSFLFSL